MGTSDTSANKAVIRRHLEVAVNEHRPELWDELIAEDLVTHPPPDRHARRAGRAGYRGAVDALWVGVPDLNVEILNMVAEGDRVVVRYFERGTHKGELFGIQATGRTYQKHGFAMYRLSNGQIAELWVQEDDLGWQKQLMD